MLSELSQWGKCRFNVDLSASTWFRVGGKASLLFKPSSTENLCHFMRANQEPLTLIGVTSNLLIRDAGLDGITLKLGGFFADMMHKEDLIIAGAACFDRTIADYAAHCGLGGLEFLVGIPGTLGGAVAMNAGAYGADIQSCLAWIEVVTKAGDLVRLNASTLSMKYRHTTLPEGCVVVKAALKGIPENAQVILSRMQTFLEKREAAQPVRTRTGGSTFKNPEGHHAWKLIDEAGCRGLSVGGAQVSEKHCNFLINTGNATAKELETLGEEIRERVHHKSGIWLEWEIKRL